MPYFLESVAAHIYKNYGRHPDTLCVVIPNRRGALYLKKYLGALIHEVSWIPTILSAEEFIERLSGLTSVNDLVLTFHMYDAYMQVCGGEAVSFEQFLRWSPQVLQDFNEIDRYLVNPETIFENLKSIREIESWSLGSDELSPLQQKYLDFMRNMGRVYQALKEKMLAENCGWQGLSYKLAYEKLLSDGYGLPYKKILFCGFNAVNLAEEKILSFLVEKQVADLLWDADAYYLKDGAQEAGLFLRRHGKWMQQFPNFISDDLSTTEKTVEITGVAGKMAQVAAAAQAIDKLLTEGYTPEKTAVVLCDETILLPVLGVLPATVQSVNVTLEYPASSTPLYDLYEQIIQMQLHKKESKSGPAFYFKDVLAVLHNPFYAELWEDGFALQDAIRRLNKSNAVYIRTGLLKNLFGEHFEATQEFFSDMTNALQATTFLCRLNENSIEKLHEKLNRSIELETALIFQKELNALRNMLETHPEVSLRGLRVLLRQLLAGTGIPFYGEPLSGLQVMGVLETRTLDFDHVIMLSVNEGVLPSGKSSASFIPDDLKRHLEMPLHGEKDAIYAYHFYRLLQRAKNISLIYNTETDTFGKGEKSRFITQLLAEWKKKNPQVKISEKVLSLPVGNSQTEFNVRIKKSEMVLQRLLGKAQSEKGLSPTALNTYKECELKFYFRFLANIREPDEVEEDIESSALGDIMHKSLEKLYTPFVGKNISATDIAGMKKKADAVAAESFSEYYNESAEENGKKAIALHVIKKYLSNVLDLEQEQSVEFKPGIRVDHLEKELSAELELKTGMKITLAGKADRIDHAVGTLRIVDYKSSVKKGYDKFNFTSLDEVFFDTKFSKALQLLIYAWLAWKNKLAPAESIFPCIIPFRAEEKVYSLASGKTALQMSNEFFLEFESKLSEFIGLIFAPEKDFNPVEDTGVCLLCTYQSICNRV